MKKLLLLIIATTITALHAGHINWQEIEEDAKYAVVQVMNHANQQYEFEPFKKNYDEQRSGGSGFFINEDGEFLTNYHVIANAKKLEICMPALSRQRFEAELVGCKPERDVALCRLTEQGKTDFITFLGSVPGCNGIIQHLTLADDEHLSPVQEVMALGYPLLDGFKRTVGHINGLSLHTGTLYCQISAPINQGSSGGPLLNAHGHVIGINSAGIPGASVVGYMIPLHYFTRLVDDMRANKVITSDFGAYLQPITSNIADAFSCPHTGMLVTEVLAGSLASDMGMQPHDIVTSINGYPLDNDGLIKVDWIDARVPYEDAIERLHVGDQIELTVWRNGSLHTLTGTLPAQSTVTVDKQYPEQGSIAYRAFGGVVVQPLCLNHLALAVSQVAGMVNPDLYTYLHKPKHRVRDALIISKVYSCSQAEHEYSLQPGALISKVNEIPVSTLAELDTALAQAAGDFVTLTMRDNSVACLHVPTLLVEDEDLRDTYGYKKCAGVIALSKKS